MWEDMMMVTGGRVFGGSEMTGILHSEGIPQETIDALLTSTPPACFGGPRPVMMPLEPVQGSMTSDRPCFRAPHPAHNTPPATSATMMVTNDSDLDDCGLFLQQYAHPNPTDPKKRRLTCDQVQVLERSFEAENKLEPERKAEIARSLGLQPRQVAIWFQNRRARWKTKQLERDYESVRAGYDAMKQEYEAARKEKEKLEAEVNYLREQLLNRQKKRRRSSTGAEAPDDETQPQRPAGWTTPEEKMKIRSEEEASALRKQGEMFGFLQHEDLTETDQSELSHAEEEDLEGVVAVAAYRYGFPTGVDEHSPQPLWQWHPAELCGP